jgi:hypothetical protein
VREFIAHLEDAKLCFVRLPLKIHYKFSHRSLQPNGWVDGWMKDHDLSPPSPREDEDVYMWG